MGSVSVLYSELQFKRHPKQGHDREWSQKQCKLDHWCIGVLNNVMQHEMVVNVIECYKCSIKLGEV
jgi:hypothetical protein